MAFSTSTYILQQQPGGQPPDSSLTQLNPGFSSRHNFSAQSARHQSYEPVGQAAHTTQTQDLAASQVLLRLHTEVQALEQKLDTSLRKNREYERILHLATLNRSRQSKTQHGIICLECNQEVVHACPSPSQYNQPLSTLGDVTGLPTGPTAQENLFSEHIFEPPASVFLESSIFQVQPLHPSSSSISSVFTSHSTNYYPPTSAMSLHRSFTQDSQYDPSIDNSYLGKRYLHDTDLDCEPATKKARQSLPQERIGTDQQSQPHLPRYVTPSELCVPSSKDSFSLHPTTSVAPSGILVSPSSPESATSEENDDVVTSEEESEVDRLNTYNANKTPDIRSLDVGRQIFSLGFSDDGNHLAVGLYDHETTIIYDVQTGQETCTLKEFVYGDDIHGKDKPVYHVCFSPDGRYLATRGGTFTRIWEISKKHVRNFIRTTSSHYHPFSSLITSLRFSPDGRLIASCRFGRGRLEIWNWRDGSRKLFEYLETGAQDICFSPDGRYIILVLQNGDVLIWDVRTGRLVKKLKAHRLWVYSVAFTPDGTGLFSGGHSTLLFSDLSFLGRLRDGKLQLENGTGREEPQKSFGKHTSNVYFVAVSSNGRWVISCAQGGVIHVSNVSTAELRREVRLHNGLDTFHFSPNSGCLAAAEQEGTRVLLCRFKEILD